MSDPIPAPTPAATVIPLRESEGHLEVLMLRRNSRGQFGGMWVFPGGQVDQADHPAGVPDELAAARVAAVREAREEAGIDIDPDTLEVLSFWMPPPESPRRFATWFFVASLGAIPDVVIDHGEIREHRWLTPAEAIRLRDAGEWELAPPTFTTLWWLRSFGTAADAVAAAAAQDTPPKFETHIAMSADNTVMATVWAGDAAYESRDLSAPGPRRRLVMDPAGWRVETDS
ncbi:MAG TPA: NUDIX domain-containing protein [Acidimicrobiales bacterium]|nr:NUDIX domain-containing protein [Acidimicrobiales bacterium]